MPGCYLNTEYVKKLATVRPQKRTCYYDADLAGFMLEHRPTGAATWYFRYKTEDGKFHMLKLGLLEIMNAVEARAKAYDMRQAVRNGLCAEEGLQRMRGLNSFQAFAEGFYLPNARVKKRSWTKDSQLLRMYIFPALGTKRMDRVTRLDIVNWQNSLLEQKLSASSCNRVTALLKHIFNYAVKLEFMDRNPCSDIPPFKTDKFRERYLSEEEAKRLMLVLDHEENQLLANAIRLLLLTGARKNEILAARWENVDTERRILTVPISKSGKARHIPLSDEALSVFHGIQHGIQRGESPWVFPSPKTKSHILMDFKVWNAIRRKGGLDGLRLHDLRHSFASFLVNEGRSLYEVQKILGHYEPKVTMRYAHLAQASLVQAANIIGGKVMGSKQR